MAASRRGHTAKLRKVLNGLGVLCYYTFSVKGFEENYAVFAPNSRSLQEKEEEKVWGKLSAEQEKEFLNLLRNSKDRAAAVQRFCTFHQIPFVATDPAGYRQEHDFRNYRYDKRGKTDTGI